LSQASAVKLPLLLCRLPATVSSKQQAVRASDKARQTDHTKQMNRSKSSHGLDGDISADAHIDGGNPYMTVPRPKSGGFLLIPPSVFCQNLVALSSCASRLGCSLTYAIRATTKQCLNMALSVASITQRFQRSDTGTSSWSESVESVPRVRSCTATLYAPVTKERSIPRQFENDILITQRFPHIYSITIKTTFKVWGTSTISAAAYSTTVDAEDSSGTHAHESHEVMLAPRD
jgi:hypothetical protein